MATELWGAGSNVTVGPETNAEWEGGGHDFTFSGDWGTWSVWMSDSCMGACGDCYAKYQKDNYFEAFAETPNPEEGINIFAKCNLSALFSDDDLDQVTVNFYYITDNSKTEIRVMWYDGDPGDGGSLIGQDLLPTGDKTAVPSGRFTPDKLDFSSGLWLVFTFAGPAFVQLVAADAGRITKIDIPSITSEPEADADEYVSIGDAVDALAPHHVGAPDAVSLGDEIDATDPYAQTDEDLEVSDEVDAVNFNVEVVPEAVEIGDAIDAYSDVPADTDEAADVSGAADAQSEYNVETDEDVEVSPAIDAVRAIPLTPLDSTIIHRVSYPSMYVQYPAVTVSGLVTLEDAECIASTGYRWQITLGNATIQARLVQGVGVSCETILQGASSIRAHFGYRSVVTLEDATSITNILTGRLVQVAQKLQDAEPSITLTKERVISLSMTLEDARASVAVQKEIRAALAVVLESAFCIGEVLTGRNLAGAVTLEDADGETILWPQLQIEVTESLEDAVAVAIIELPERFDDVILQWRRRAA